MEDYYKILEVDVTATTAEIRAAYRRLAKLFHPDKNPAQDKEEWTVEFQKISVAYEVLSNPEKRNEYNYKVGARKRSASRPLFPGPRAKMFTNIGNFYGGLAFPCDNCRVGTPAPPTANFAPPLTQIDCSEPKCTITLEGLPGENKYAFPGGTGYKSSFGFIANSNSSNTFTFPVGSGVYSKFKFLGEGTTNSFIFEGPIGLGSSFQIVGGSSGQTTNNFTFVRGLGLNSTVTVMGGDSVNNLSFPGRKGLDSTLVFKGSTRSSAVAFCATSFGESSTVTVEGQTVTRRNGLDSEKVFENGKLKVALENENGKFLIFFLTL
jgi:curved DNA-binding protein CbpA